MKATEMRSDCPISSSLDIFGDKWSLLIVRDLMLHKSRTYGDFTKSAEKIATNILANRLQLLEDNGIIIKLPYPGNKVKGLYRLSPKGVDLIPALIEIALWGGRNISNTYDGSPFLKEVKKSKTKFLKKVMDDLLEEETNIG
ncbi:helix-turn-helix domain-containing protein [Maribacter sp. PR1]|uniref:Helix-turn-helix domain-containing protein n=1 Tax=Maribacter cobaltidurans TaxID=1178778 RepID=A0ABU7IYC3_9FLAO|nr:MULTISPECIES: helix-turn-helix domain-containing protein [Maribacter]MDC6390601.1 helix-turn-helix domain-containing protein [Maribacter sp. PR1]MEE1977992.1 helix-turn-helix domain-containing protein [Maribacter cobaltidurans]